MADLQPIIEKLHRESCSCVIANGDVMLLCHGRGVSDLWRLLGEQPEVLDGALVADKVVGKGAAALMVLGRVAAVYTDLISRPALNLLQGAGIDVEYGECVPNIINRAGNDICPVEKLCADAATAADCLPLIDSFISQMKK